MFQVDRVRILPLVTCTHDFVTELFAWAHQHQKPGATPRQLGALKRAARAAKPARLGELASQPSSLLPVHMATLAGSVHLPEIIKNYEDITQNYQAFLDNGAPETLSAAAKAVADPVFRYFYENLLGQATFWQKYPSLDTSVRDKLTLRTAMGRVHAICPYCDLVKVQDPSQSTVDHFLAQDHFPVLAIYGDNLLAACYSCNLAIKNAKFIGTPPTGPAKHIPIFHPLFHQAAEHMRFEFDSQTLAPVNLAPDPQNSPLAGHVGNFTALFGLQSKYSNYAQDMDYAVNQFVPRVRDRFQLRALETGQPKDMALLQQVLAEVAEEAYNTQWGMRGMVDKTKLHCDLYRFLGAHLTYFAKDRKLIP